MACTSKLQNNIRNGFPILDNPTKVLSFMFRTLLVLKLLKCPTPDGGHLGFVQNGACGTIWTIIWLSLLKRGCHSSLGSSGVISISHSGVSRGHRNVLIQSDNRYMSAPWASQPDSPLIRSVTSDRSHFSLGYTNLRRSCTSPNYTDFQSNFPQHYSAWISLSPHGALPTHQNIIQTKSWLYKLASMNNKHPLLLNTSVSLKNVLKTHRLPRVTTGGRHR